MLAALATVFRSPARVVAAAAIAALVLAGAALLPNFALLRIVLASPDIGSGRALAIIVSLLGSLATNFTPLAAAYTVLTAALIGVNAVLAFYLVRRARGIGGRAAASSLGGMLAGVFGLGCAACGSVILSAVVGTFVGAGAVALLPLGGQEFGILGVILLAASTYALLRRARQPLTCALPVTHYPSTT